MDVTQIHSGGQNQFSQPMGEETQPQEYANIRIRSNPGKLKQTNISICGYEMHEMELLDRALIGIQKTENAFIDVNNRIIQNVNQRKDRINNLNGRIATLATKTLKLYNCDSAMRVESLSQFPKLENDKSAMQHPHTSIFYDHKAVMLDENNEDPNKYNEDYNLPELYSMQFNKKLYNNRLSNHYDNLGQLVTGITKDIREVSDMLLGLEKYGVHFHQTKNQIREELMPKKKMNLPQMGMTNQDKKNQQLQQNQGLLGSIPDTVESIAELMLQDSDINVYQQSKVTLKEEAFVIRGKKQKTRAQKEQIIHERRKEALKNYQQQVKGQKSRVLEEDRINIMKPREEELFMRMDNEDEFQFRPDYKPAAQLEIGNLVSGLKGVTDFEAYDQVTQQKKLQQQTIDQSVIPDGQDGELGDDNMNDMTRGSECHDMLAPTLQVKQQQQELQRRKEENERKKQERIAKQVEQQQTGEDDGLTSVPLDVLFKQRLEQKILVDMGGTIPQDSQSAAPKISLATTQQSQQSEQIGGGGQPARPPADSTTKGPPPPPPNTSSGPSVSGIPQAPKVELLYEMLNGGKKPEPPKTEGDALGDLLGEADIDLEFKPDDIEFGGGLEESQINPPKPPPKPKAAPVLSMAEQLQQQREKMKKAQEAKEAAAAGGGPPEEEKKAAPAKDMSQMTMAEQLQHQRAEMARKDAEKKAKIESGELVVKPKPIDMSRMTMAEQLAHQRKLNEEKTKAKQAAALPSISEEKDESANKSGLPQIGKNKSELKPVEEEDDGSLFKMPMGKKPAPKNTMPLKTKAPGGLLNVENRRSNMDQLADQIKQRFQVITKKQTDYEDSDSNPSSSDSMSDDD